MWATLKRNWVRWARLAGGLFLIATGLWYYHDLTILFGLFLVVQSFTRMPCGFCEAGFCERPEGSNDQVNGRD